MKLCECGCGQPAPIATQTDARVGTVKGQPRRYVNGHNPKRSTRPYVERMTYTLTMAGAATHCWKPPQVPERNGYVRVANNGSMEYAHVLVWQHRNGPVPEGLELDHLCRNRWCIKPAHLEPVTRAVNVQRGLTAKLDPAAVVEIRNSTEPLRVLAERYGVSVTTAWQARRGLTWKNAWLPAEDAA